MKKRCLTALLALILVLSTLPMQAWAAPAASPYGQSALTGANLQIYNALKDKIVQIADGSLDSSTFRLDVSKLGITYSNGTLHGMDDNLIFTALLADLPYELYWFEKTRGWECSWLSSSNGQVTSMVYKLHVYKEYAALSADGRGYDRFRLDTAKTGAAKACLKTAQELVNRCAGLSDYDKLSAYRDYICENNTYNHKAAESGSNIVGGGPWQMIYVFDNDPNTNVVCEGYSKAFKYLCDLSVFSNDVACYIVSGDADGRHMWNIVRINDQSYLADITNCDVDNGSAKPLDAPFLAGDPNSTANGCAVHLPQYEFDDGSYTRAQDIRYTYEPNAKQLYSADILTLAHTRYSPSAPSFTDLPGWCAREAQWAAEQGIARGTGGGRFSPDTPCTQEQILTFLWRAAGKQPPAGTAPFAVSADYADAVNWAYGKGMIGSSFEPKAPCTRAAAVTYIWLALGGSAPHGGSTFTDVAGDDPYAAAVAWAAETGVSNGYDNGDGTFRFQPGKVCSRGEIVTLLHRAYV